MLYIWLDESDKKGQYFSNFYGGILIDSRVYESFLSEAMDLLQALGIEEEIKWQKVNEYTFEKYKSIVDFIFDKIEKGDAKIRIFFRSNQYKAQFLTDEQKRNEFTILYYEFIKHSFGLEYCTVPEEERHVRLYLDDIPARGSQVMVFKKYILKLNDTKSFMDHHVTIRENDIIEVNSADHLPLQMLDLVLGAICFRLNDKHKVKNPDTGKRGKRTMLKEKLYKYIYARIAKIRPNFNIGVSTGILRMDDRWHHPYAHWSFKPRGFERDLSAAK